MPDAPPYGMQIHCTTLLLFTLHIQVLSLVRQYLSGSGPCMSMTSNRHWWILSECLSHQRLCMCKPFMCYPSFVDGRNIQTSVLLFSQLRYQYLPPHTIPELPNQQEYSQAVNDDE